jgi:glycosyltransferase involved in cell wall biosynthesis
MKILWITNILFPDICKELGIKELVTGGWMYSLAKLLICDSSVKLAVATVYPGKILMSKEINGISYFLLPLQGDNKRYSKNMEKYWLEVQNEFQPDAVHIHGTEFAHGLAYIRACPQKNVTISIQGLLSVYERYYYTGITSAEIFKNISLRDILKMDTIFQQRVKMRKRGLLEHEYIQSVDYVIGRTSWDMAHVLTINPKVNYLFCNETLRGEFYQHTWSLKSCEKHSVFVSQAAYPIKGLHQVLKALPSVLKKYPDTKLYIGGSDCIPHNLKEKLLQTGYDKYILRLMKKLNIRDKVIFTGILGEKEMCNRYLKSHIFVCPSSIENSPNSVGESQLLGVPCIASYVGGIPDMVENGKTGLLYRFEETEMLSKAICEIFGNDNLAELLSFNEQAVAVGRHSGEVNRNTMIAIYKAIS